MKHNEVEYFRQPKNTVLPEMVLLEILFEEKQVRHSRSPIAKY